MESILPVRPGWKQCFSYGNSLRAPCARTSYFQRGGRLVKILVIKRFLEIVIAGTNLNIEHSIVLGSIVNNPDLVTSYS